MSNHKLRGMLGLLILLMLISACGNNHADQRISHAEGYLEDLGSGDANAAQEHVCERRQREIDRIMDSTDPFRGQRGTFAIEDIACYETDQFVECEYTLSAEIFELVEHEDGTAEHVLLQENKQSVSEIYRFEDNRICGVVETVVEGDSVQLPSAVEDTEDTAPLEETSAATASVD